MSWLFRSIRSQRTALTHGCAKMLLLGFGLVLFAGGAVELPAGGQVVARERSEVLIARQQSPAPGGLQRGSVPGTSQTGSAVTLQCQRQLANLDRNSSTWSWLAGAVLFIIFIYVLTAWGRMTTYVRLFVALGASILLGPVVLALYIRELMRACPGPTSLFDSLFVPVVVWTILGSVSVAAVLAAFRWVFVVRREFGEKQESV
jgi:hypothetical protein